MQRLVALLVLLAAASLPAVDRIEITDPDLDEISGIVVAHSHDGYWVHNDSGDLPRLFAIDRSGKRLATIRVMDATSLDWEDLAAFELDGRRYLMVGDIGDNKALLPERALYVIEEPAHDPAIEPSSPRSVPLAWRIRFTYPDGPRDAEGLAVDAASGEVLILSKRSSPPALYRLPLRPADEGAIRAERLGTVVLPDPPAELRAQKGRFAAEAHFPTAMEIDPGSRQLVLSTYVQALLYRRDPSESWLQALQRPPQDLGLPVLKQTEAACFDRDATAVIIASEQLPAVLLRLALPAP